MTYRLTFCIVLICTQCGFAQNSDTAKLDSIVNWLENHVKVFEDSTLLGENSRKANQLSKKIDDPKALATSYYFLSVYHREYSKLDSALYYLNKVKDIYTEQNNSDVLAKTHLELKAFYTLKAEYDKATEYAYLALDRLMEM